MSLPELHLSSLQLLLAADYLVARFFSGLGLERDTHVSQYRNLFSPR